MGPPLLAVTYAWWAVDWGLAGHQLAVLPFASAWARLS